MEERDWIILQVLYQQKNITKTAQALYLSQPALTARLQQIEKEFDTKIVHRTPKGVHFTPQGEYLVRSSSEILLKLRKIREQVLNFDEKVAGTLRIGSTGYFTMYTLPNLLRQFREQYPDVEFKVTTAWSKDVFNLVHNQSVHFGFISSDYGWQDKKHLLFTEPIYAASMKPFTLEELPRLSRIDYQSDSQIKATIEAWWWENFSEPPTISMEVDRLTTCKEMVKHGLGYGILPNRILGDLPGLHKVVLSDKDGRPLTRKALMIYYEESLHVNALKAFARFVEQMEIHL